MLQQKLLAQVEKDKARADHMRRSSDIHIGDQVLLSMKHLQLKDKPGKLCPIFIGPFWVMQEIKRNAMKLDLPASISVHPVFNVSFFKKYYKDRLLPNVVQVEDDAKYKIDLIYITKDICIINSTSFDRRGMVLKRTCGSQKRSCDMYKSSCNIKTLPTC